MGSDCQRVWTSVQGDGNVLQYTALMVNVLMLLSLIWLNCILYVLYHNKRKPYHLYSSLYLIRHFHIRYNIPPTFSLLPGYHSLFTNEGAEALPALGSYTEPGDKAPIFSTSVYNITTAHPH